MGDKNNHFLEDITITKFKCFEDFKVDGFKRVNLITGKNNVGKTAFMEAMYLYGSIDLIQIYQRLLVLKTYRNTSETLLAHNSDDVNLKALIMENDNILIGNKIQSYLKNFNINENNHIPNNIFVMARYSEQGIFLCKTKNEDIVIKASVSDIINKVNAYIENTKYATDRIFIGTSLDDNELLEKIIGDLKIQDKYSSFNDHLHKLFNIENIDFINKKPMAKINNKFQDLSSLGEGIKSIIFYIGSLLTLKDNYIFIDEIENGIYYELLDELWEIILTISKEQNIQVFATTHSKECIDSYERVAHKLDDKDIACITLTKLKDNSIIAGVRDLELMRSTLEDERELR